MTDAIARRHLFGLDFADATSVDEVAEVLLAVRPVPLDPEHDRRPVVVTPNVDQLVKRSRGIDAVASRVAAQAMFVLADGQPIVWASRLLREPLQTRLAGSDLVASIWPQLVLVQRRVLVVASSATVVDLVQREGSGFHAIEAPLLDLERRAEFGEFVSLCLDTAVAADVEYVFVTLGYPKQCNVIDAMVRDWPPERPIPTFLAVGASFDMYFGLVRRAPSWMQRAGLEWLFRFIQEPTRLFRRYFVEDLAFAPMVLREWRLRRRSSS